LEVAMTCRACFSLVSATAACLLERPTIHGISSEPNNIPVSESVSGWRRKKSIFSLVEGTNRTMRF
jgi:hypothetical protein